MQPRKILAAAVAAAAVAVSLVAGSGTAATPSSGTVGPSKTTLKWSGEVPPSSSVLQFEAGSTFECPPAAVDVANLVCDHFTFTVDVPQSYWKTHHGGVRITMSKTAADFDTLLYDMNDQILGDIRGTGPGPLELYIPNASGPYELRMFPLIGFGTSYTGSMVFTTKNGPDPGYPLGGPVAFHAKVLTKVPEDRPRNKPVAYKGPQLSFRSTYVGRDAAEPTIGVDRKGNAFFTAAWFDAIPGNPPKNEPRTVVLRSSDGNRTYQPVQPTVGPINNPPVTFDPYIYVDEDTGRVFSIDLEALTGSHLIYSDDQGKTWTTSALTNPGVNDHQTLFSAVPPEGGLQPIDPAFPKILYYCVNQISDASCSRSLDGGRTFLEAGQPAYVPADTASGQTVCGSLFGHLRADHHGRIFLPKGHCGSPWVAISEDEGQTWTNVKISSGISAAGIQTALAVDDSDNVYATWWDEKFRQPYLAVSRDHGKTWSKPRMVAPPGVNSVNFPVITAGEKGKIALMFPGTTAPDDTDIARPWNSYFVVSTDALSADPLFVSNIANPGGPKDPVHRGDCIDRCSNMYDFLSVFSAPDARGTLWASVVDTCTVLMSCKSDPQSGAGEVNTSDGQSADAEGVAVMQLSGPWLRTKPPKKLAG